jgi:hypothetical protein
VGHFYDLQVVSGVLDPFLPVKEQETGRVEELALHGILNASKFPDVLGLAIIINLVPKQ